jgi:hypothetical protein
VHSLEIIKRMNAETLAQSKTCTRCTCTKWELDAPHKPWTGEPENYFKCANCDCMYEEHQTLSERIDAEVKRREQGNWVPACNGTEVPFRTRTGLRLLYCWQPSTGKHAYINCDTDIILSEDEARAALATY